MKNKKIFLKKKKKKMMNREKVSKKIRFKNKCNLEMLVVINLIIIRKKKLL